MWKYLIVMSLCFSCNFYTKTSIGDDRTEIKFKTNSIEVDDDLLPYVEAYIKDANQYVNVDSLSENYLGVYRDSELNSNWGLTITSNNNEVFTLINTAAKDKNKIRLIVYHELSHHYLKEEHCHSMCNQIMASAIGTTGFYSNWDKQKRVLFHKLPHDSVGISYKGQKER